MPPVKGSKVAKLRGSVSEFGSDIFSTDDNVLFCKYCEITVGNSKRFLVIQHLKTEKHKSNVSRKNKNKVIQPMLSFAANENSKSKLCQFSKDLCEAFVAANIPLSKLSNSKLKSFLEKYCDKFVPDESTLRKTYIGNLYDQTVTKISNAVKDKNLWVSMDETTDSCGRYIVSVIVGVLEQNTTGKAYLANIEEVVKTNHSTVAQCFENAMQTIFPGGIQRHRILFFVTDAAPYMVKAASGLKVLYPKMVHLTCLAHAIHRVCEEVRANYSEVDIFISNMKKIFLKAPSRCQIFREVSPHIPLPPKPVITRWGTWLDAVLYYSQNFVSVVQVIEKLNPESSASIQLVKELINSSSLKENVCYISSNFGTLTEKITQIQKRDMQLCDSLEVIEEIENTLKTARGSIAKTVANKFNYMLEKNSGYSTLKIIAGILSGDKNAKLNYIAEDLTPEDVTYFKYCPITSCDVERSFSRYKTLLADNRHSFTKDNLRMIFVGSFNSE